MTVGKVQLVTSCKGTVERLKKSWKGQEDEEE